MSGPVIEQKFEGYPRVDTEKFFFPPIIVVLAGFPRVGKSTLANALVNRTNLVHCDVDRARYQKHPPETPPPRGTEEEEKERMAQAYRRNHQQAKEALLRNQPVILNATYSRRSYHELLEQLARETGNQIVFFLLEAPDEVIRQRIETGQQSSVSNIVTFDQFTAVRDRYEPYHDGVIRIDTSLPIDTCVKTILEHLNNTMTTTS